MTLLSALACLGTDASTDGVTSTDAGPTDSADPGIHPNVPPGYEYKWDTTGESCDKGTQYYFLAWATTDEDGHFVGEHKNYWFYGGDWEEDDIDTYSLEGDPISRATLDTHDAGECEEGYLVVRKGVDMQTGWSGDETDLMYAFDTLSPSGNLNYENAMLVFRYTQGGWGSDDDEWKGDFDYARGVFTPDDASNPSPPATYTWEGSGCYG